MAVSRILSPGTAEAARIDGHLSCPRTLAHPGTVLADRDYYPEVSLLAQAGQATRPSCSVLHRMGFIVPP